MSDLVEARVGYRFRKASAEDVYDAWLDERDVRAWMTEALAMFRLSGEIREVQIAPRVGGRFLFTDLRNGEEARHWGAYRALNRPGLIEFTWFTTEEDERDGSSVVRIEINSEAAGCSVVLTHAMDPKYAEYRDQAEQGWRTLLDAVAKHAESGGRTR